MSIFVGIDLGTTFSAVARIDEHGRPVIVPSATGAPVTPSIIYFGSDPPAVGEEARLHQAAGAREVAAFFKRSMGDPHFLLEFNGRSWSPIDLSALVLSHLKQTAEKHLGDSIRQAVITVPAYFTNAQREATIEAGRRAGLEVLRIINEPTAAALAYGVNQSDRTETLLVYDLGGGTFDVTLVSVTPTSIDVRGTDGDHNLGGKDWDDRVAGYLGECFERDHGNNPLEDTAAANDLLVKAETAKKALSNRRNVTIQIDHASRRVSYPLTREQFEELTADLMERTQRLTEQVLRDARLTWNDLAGVLLVGGSTRMPMVHRYVERMSGKPPRTGVNVDEAVALGAAVQAAIDVQALAPQEKPRFRLGSAKTIRDVMSHSLGVVARSEDDSRCINSIIIPKNIQIPCAKSKTYQLRTRRGQDNQLDVYLVQGESEEIASCHVQNKYTFSQITHLPRGIALVEIEYGYDQCGVITVAATEQSTGKKLPMQVQPLPTDLSWLSEVRDPTQQQRGSPYTVHAGLQRIPGAITDRFGNAAGSQYDLAEDDAFEDCLIAVLHLYTGEGFDFRLPTAALEEKGFRIKRWTRVPSERELAEVLEDACQLWLISDQTQHLGPGHLRVIKDFFERGMGLYLWGDNEPYFADANYVAQEVLGCRMRGNVHGDQVVQPQQRHNQSGFISHLITTGIEYLYEGITIATLDGSSQLEPLLYGSSGNLLIATRDDGDRRAILDGGFTRLFVKWDTAGTGRYVKNAASWLVNFEKAWR
jgi:molecular chaperone DnaK